MKMNMNQWLADLKSANVKKALPILSFPCVSKLGIPVSELITDRPIFAGTIGPFSLAANSMFIEYYTQGMLF